MATEDLFSVRGKAAVVTGGTSGIGQMIAGGLVDARMRVYVASRKADACARVAAELSERGTCVGLPADLSTEAGCVALAAAVAEREPAVHLLVNNAGATWGAPLEEYPDAAFDKLWAINVKGVFHLTRALLPQLRGAATQDDPARVVNIGSADGLRVPVTENYAYSAAKAAVHMLTRHLASTLARDHITVNAVAPGPFDSRMMAFVLDDPAGREAVASSVPLGRVGRPDDVAGTVIFLASRAGAYLTGAIIPVDGGISGR
jgi:NAD(P)-dependent dehydrogenase (short-subunit alcohol dehydrogenase family)